MGGRRAPYLEHSRAAKPEYASNGRLGSNLAFKRWLRTLPDEDDAVKVLFRVLYPMDMTTIPTKQAIADFRGHVCDDLERHSILAFARLKLETMNDGHLARLGILINNTPYLESADYIEEIVNVLKRLSISASGRSVKGNLEVQVEDYVTELITMTDDVASLTLGGIKRKVAAHFGEDVEKKFSGMIKKAALHVLCQEKEEASTVSEADVDECVRRYLEDSDDIDTVTAHDLNEYVARQFGADIAKKFRKHIVQTAMDVLSNLTQVQKADSKQGVHGTDEKVAIEDDQSPSTGTEEESSTS